MLHIPTLLALFVSGLWIAAAWWALFSWTDGGAAGAAFFGPPLSLRRIRSVLFLVCVAFGGVAAATPSLWIGISNWYRGDSLFTLDPLKIVGVSAISLSLITLLFWGLAAALIPLARAVAPSPLLRLGTAILSVAGAVFAFGVAHSATPQIYYAFYRRIIPGLPDQWVIRTWLDGARLREAARLPEDGSLALHLTGLTLWTVVIVSSWLFALRWRAGDWQASPLQVGLGSALLLSVRHFL